MFIRVMKYPWYLKAKLQSKISSLIKNYYIAISMQKNSSNHQFSPEMQPI